MTGSTQQWRCAPSARLSYRPLAEYDESLYCALYTDAEVMRNIGAPLTQLVAQRYFRRSLEVTHKTEFARRVIALTERTAEQAIGIFNIQRAAGDGAAAEVGTMLVPRAQRQGFVPECLRALMTHAFAVESLAEIHASAVQGNEAVEKILTRLGFELRGLKPRTPGVPVCTDWALTRDVWDSRRKGMHYED